MEMDLQERKKKRLRDKKEADALAAIQNILLKLQDEIEVLKKK